MDVGIIVPEVHICIFLKAIFIPKEAKPYSTRTKFFHRLLIVPGERARE